MSKSKVQRQVKSRHIVLVTGATSGMGRMLVERLLASGDEVRVLLKKPPSEHIEWRQLPSGVRIYVADIKLVDDRTREVLMEACKGVDAIFHLAAVTYTNSSRYKEERTDTNLMVNTNVIGTENILQAYSDANPGSKLKFIYTSSVSVYGYRRHGEVLTEESEPKPITPYGESKYMAEQVVKAFGAANKNLTYTILRLGVIYGKGYEKSFMMVFKLITEKKLRYVGKGENHLTLITVDDAVDAIIDAIRSNKAANKTYNVTDGVPYTQRQLFDKAAKLLKVEGPKKGIHPLLARLAAKSHGIGDDQLEFLMSDRIISIKTATRDIGFKQSVDIDTEGRRLAKEFLGKYRK